MSNPIRPIPNWSRLSTLVGANTVAYWPLIGGGTGGTGNISAIQRGNPTVIRLAAAPAVLIGQYVLLDGIVGTTELNGTYARVIARRDSVLNSIVVDVDSAAMSAYTSGGTISTASVADRFGNVAPFELTGTLTSIWNNASDGLTPNAAGTHSNGRIGINAPVFDLSTFAGILVINAWVRPTTLPGSVATRLFSLGRPSSSGANTVGGGVFVSAITSSQFSGSFYPRAAADGAVTVTAVSLTAMTASTLHSIGVAVDCRDPAAPVMYGFLDGNLRASATVNMTGAIGLPSAINGAAIGSGLSGALVQNEFYGTDGSAIRTRGLLWAKLRSDVNLADMSRLMTKLAARHELPAELADLAAP